MGVDGDRDGRPSGARPPVSLVGALVCVGVALLLTVGTGVVTFALSQSYGFGPVWDRSAFMMTGAAGVLAGAALLVAVRLARLRLRALPVMAGWVALVFVVGYVAGVAGNSLRR
ncbi:hypothetical protein BJ986_002279 [Phycicoccus badiiscoriae]|uniref:Uncharacterized protein n=2 Tax=Actinomycetes TaxID=1760 RepID=A0A852WRF9_9MICO|nr:hypothetical protein [Amycolatopsis jiangsuensis]NYG07786.1 hypothetical protein [Pedococcus badiiscoriae]NYG07792.1 hypothetical protein [Pedococcus badiiscoriae]